MSKKTILFVGGGSGGHIAPILAVIEALLKQAPEVRCIYAGLESDLSSPLITSSNLNFEKIAVQAGKLHRHFSFNQLSQFSRFGVGMVQASLLLSRLKPDLVFAKGGFVSVPLALAAARKGIPIVCHETDLIPGLANRLVARHARTIFTAFPADAYTQLDPEKLLFVGQPVREAFFAPLEEHSIQIDGWEYNSHKPLILVVAGSQGAQFFNQVIPTLWARLLETCQIVHCTGTNEYGSLLAESVKLPEKLRKNILVKPFIATELPELMRRSTLVISRPGGTIAELAASGVPVILIPIPHSAQNHQYANAAYFAAQGAAKLLEQKDITVEYLGKQINDLLQNKEERQKMSEAIKAFARPEAAEEMAKAICNLLRL